jgi:HEPN domain-containing protein
VATVNPLQVKFTIAGDAETTAPRTHNLIDLAQRAHVALSQGQQDFLGKLNNISVIVRYPDDLSALVSQYPEAIARDYLERTKELIAWLCQDPRLQPS